MKRLVTVFSIGVILLAVDGCRYSDVRSTHKGVEYRITPCESIRASQTAAFIFNESNKVESTAKVNIVLPVDRRLRAFVEANIARNWKYASGPKAPSISGYKDLVSDFFTDFEEGQVECKKEFLKSGEMPFLTGWDLALSGEIRWESEKYFSFRSSIYTYFGGVHPDEYFRNGTYSRKLGRRMAVSDLFKEKDLLSVATIICKEISESLHSSEYLRNVMSNTVVMIQRGDYRSYADYMGNPDNIGAGDVGGNPNVTDNFMIVEDGIVWTYNEYEIASYSEGHTDVLVPWKSLVPYLKSKDIIDAPIAVGFFEHMRNTANEKGQIKRIGNLEFF